MGIVLLAAAALLLLPLITALYYHESPVPFLIAMGAAVVPGLPLAFLKPKRSLYTAREGFVIVGAGWIILSLIAALPFTLSGDIPSYLDAVFETVSGLTTTGSTILNDVEALSRGVQFWRLFCHWIGGMGILVFIMAVLPMAGNRSMHIMRAEVPGPTVGKLVPRARQTARILYLLYLILTLVETALLKLGGLRGFAAVKAAHGRHRRVLGLQGLGFDVLQHVDRVVVGNMNHARVDRHGRGGGAGAAAGTFEAETEPLYRQRGLCDRGRGVDHPVADRGTALYPQRRHSQLSGRGVRDRLRSHHHRLHYFK